MKNKGLIKLINKLIRKRRYPKAFALAFVNNIVSKEIEICDEHFLKEYNLVPDSSGRKMESYGLLKKAIEYYNHSEDPSKRNEAKRLEYWVSRSKKEYEGEANMINKLNSPFSNPEETQDTFEVIYKIKEGDMLESETLTKIDNKICLNNFLNNYYINSNKN